MGIYTYELNPPWGCNINEKKKTQMSGKFLVGGGGVGGLMGTLGIEGAINILLLVCTCHHDAMMASCKIFNKKFIVLTNNKAPCNEVAN